VSPFALLLSDDPRRLLAAFDGFAGGAIGYPVRREALEISIYTTR
jgi:hypothetical protein